MERVQSLFLLFIITIVFAACANNEREETRSGTAGEQDGVVTAKQKPVTAQTPKNVAIKEDGLNAVYGQYLNLNTALINGDAAAATIASNALEAGAVTMNDGKAIAAAASKITSASGIEAMRVQYASLSNEMIRLVRNTGVTNGAVYVDFCPMAMNNKGAYWLSNTAEIRNPYYGEEMLTCGEVKETVK